MSEVKKTPADAKKGLVLTRRIGESIMIEHGLLEIQVVEIKGKQVRLKFIGQVRVDRAERLTDSAAPSDKFRNPQTNEVYYVKRK